MSLDMANKWRKVLLGDACSKIGSGATPRGGKEAYLGGATALIRSQNIYNDRFVHDGIVFIDDKQAGELRNVVVEEGDVLLNITGDSVARCCQVAPDVLPARVNQHVSIIRPKPDVFDARFLRYAFINPAMQAHLLGLASVGATRNALTKGVIESLSISAPPLEQQRAIAHILGTLDDKIDLNRRINQTLEAMAQAIFKSWFVDFDPVKAKIAAIEQGQDPLRAAMCAISGKTELELDQMPRDDYEELAATAALFPDAIEDSELGGIPKGWAVGALSDLCHLNPESWSAKTLPDTVRYVDLANAKRGEISEIQNLGGKDIPSRARRILRHGDTVIGTVRPGNRSFALIGENGLTGSTGFAVLRPKASYWLEFVYLVATSEANIERLAHLADGGAYPAVRPEVVVHERVVVPTVSIAQAFNQYMQPLFSKLLTNRKDAILLADLRDTLLPKLLSGELSVVDLDKEEALS